MALAATGWVRSRSGTALRVGKARAWADTGTSSDSWWLVWKPAGNARIAGSRTAYRLQEGGDQRPPGQSGPVSAREMVTRPQWVSLAAREAEASSSSPPGMG